MVQGMAPMYLCTRLPGSNRENFGAKELCLSLQRVAITFNKRGYLRRSVKCLKMGWKGRAHVLRSHLHNHSLINSLAAYLDEMCPYGVGGQAVLPPKISPVLPESLLGRTFCALRSRGSTDQISFADETVHIRGVGQRTDHCHKAAQKLQILVDDVDDSTNVRPSLAALLRNTAMSRSRVRRSYSIALRSWKGVRWVSR
jgi:hypothetical protein